MKRKTVVIKSSISAIINPKTGKPKGTTIIVFPNDIAIALYSLLG